MCVSYSRRQQVEHFPERYRGMRYDRVLLPDPDAAHHPGGDALVAVHTAKGRSLQAFRWGLVPGWMRTPPSSPLYNARSETAADKPSFRGPWARRRCLVLADGFHEWNRAEGSTRRFLVGRADGGMFAMAGLWDAWRDAEGALLCSFTILTCEPNRLVAPVHHRMPVVLEAGDEAAWMDPATPAAHVARLARPWAADGWSMREATPAATASARPATAPPRPRRGSRRQPA